MLAAASDLAVRAARRQLVAEAAARRAWRSGDLDGLVAVVLDLQLRAIADGARTVPAMLSEQGLDAPPVADVNPAAWAGAASDGRPLDTLLSRADTEPALARMAATQVADATRSGTSTAMVARPKVDGYVRVLNGPTCKRCAVLAGRFYRWSSGFLRHPRCDCQMVPSTRTRGEDLLESPADAVAAGRVTDLSKAERSAIADGADVARVVNATRKGSVYAAEDTGYRYTREALRSTRLRARPTPETIYRIADTRAEAVRFLEAYGYLIRR